MKRLMALILALSMVLALGACGSDRQQDYADQEEFLEDMAKGISNRLKALDDTERTAEENVEYLAGLVDQELKEIGKYDTLIFEDERFNELAHAYIDGCKMQRLSIENYKNSNLYPTVWDAGTKVRSAIIVEMYSRYDLPLTGEEAAEYGAGVTSYTVVTPDNTSTKNDQNEKELYDLGTVITKSSERGEAALSLDKVKLKGTEIILTATNHGEIGFPSGGGGGMHVTYYDSDGYHLGGGYARLPEPWKSGVTITFEPLDISYVSYADDIAFFMVEYFVFDGTGSGGVLDTAVRFEYAFDRSGKQIDPGTLIH